MSRVNSSRSTFGPYFVRLYFQTGWPLLLRSETPELLEPRDILDDIFGEDLRALLKRGQTQLLPVNLTEIVKNILRLTQSDLIRQGVSVSMDLEPTLPAASGDYVQLQQMALNLIFNACDAMVERVGLTT